MKYRTSILFSALATSATAFAPTQSITRTLTQTNMADFNKDDFLSFKEKDKSGNLPNDRSEALPFQKRPHALDGTFAGDVGFDPIGFASSKEDLWKYREAEVKHGRLAMLASAGWIFAERFDRPLAQLFSMEPVLDASNRNPALLNGGLGKVSPVYWVSCLVAAAAIDLNGIEKSRNDPNYFPGNLGWDPLGLYPSDPSGQRRMLLAEIKHGRLAMIAITAFAFQEFVQQYAVINQTPIFFQPAQDVVDTYGASGTLTPTY
jgi:hypothetical protein